MSISQMFQDFLSNIKVVNEEQITLRYQEITGALNKKFRDTESKTSNQLQVGSYGRWTAIKGISDLDMLLYPQHQNDVPEILQLIQQVQTQSSVQLDGEIQIHPDGHVSFNELITVFPAMKQQVIVKGIPRVDMLRLEQLFEGNLEYADATTT